MPAHDDLRFAFAAWAAGGAVLLALLGLALWHAARARRERRRRNRP